MVRDALRRPEFDTLGLTCVCDALLLLGLDYRVACRSGMAAPMAVSSRWCCSLAALVLVTVMPAR